MPVITSTFENVSDIGTCLGLSLGPPAKAGVRSKRGAVHSATDLPFEQGSFDVVLCQQGLQYVPDRAAAMKKMTRVLSPGGRLALNVWGALERQPISSRDG